VDVVGDERKRPVRRQSLCGRHGGADGIGIDVTVELRQQGADHGQAPAPIRLVGRAAAWGHAQAIELAHALGEQVRLSDPGLAGDVDDAPGAGHHCLDSIGEGEQLTRPPEEDGRHAR
jgi:hypothetical protein